MDKLVNAFRVMDLEEVVSIYAPIVASFDIVPQRRQVGAEAKRKQWVDVFAMYRPPPGYEIRDLTLAVGDNVAFVHSLNRISGTLKNGQ